MDLPAVEVTDKRGDAVTIRLAVASDLAAVESHIADHSGTGSGTGGDKFLLQEFQNNVASPEYTVLLAEDAADKKGLGIFAIAWASPTETYWQSLRVSQEARGRGIATLIFKYAAQLCVKRQGPDCIARWGVVSNNEIMTGWSKRLQLAGPIVYRRHSAKPLLEGEEAVALPEGFSIRAAAEVDIPAVIDTAKGFLIASSSFGSQNFLRCGWGKINQSELRKASLGESAKVGGLAPPQPRLLYDASAALVGVANVSLVKFGEDVFMMHKYMDSATEEAFEILMTMLTDFAREVGATMIGGYVPTLDWVIELYENSSLYKRATETEQWEFEWKPADYAS